MVLTLVFWSSVRLRSLANWSMFGPIMRPPRAPGALAGGGVFAAGVLVSSARSAELKASRPPTASMAINVLFAFIFFPLFFVVVVPRWCDTRDVGLDEDNG